MRAGAIPGSLKADVSQLQVGEGIHVRDIVLPPDVTVDQDPDLLLAHVVVRAVVEEVKPETAEAEAAAAQPEVIKPERKEKEKES